MTRRGDKYNADVFRTRAVSPDVAAARRYRPYAAGEIDTVLAVEPRLGLHKAWLRAALREPGWVMPKFAVLPDHPAFAASPYAQLRPDNPVLMGASYGHHHAGMRHSRENCRCGIGEHSREFMAFLGAGGWQRALRQKNADGSPGPRAWHEAGKHHVDQQTGELIVPVDRPHVHYETLKAKYLFTPGDTGKRFDINPLTLHGADGYPSLATAARVFLILEGTLKNDSVVSAREAAINVGSVTLWDVFGEEVEAEWEEGDFGELVLAGQTTAYSELVEIAATLNGTPTIVICDSDWHHNTAVLAQAMRAVRVLEACGVPAIAAAPPEGPDLRWNHAITGQRMRAKLGVDDYMAGGGNLMEMPVRQVKDVSGLTALERQLRNRFKRPKADAMTLMLREMGMGATATGLVEPSMGELSRRLGLPPSTVRDYMRDARSAGVAEQLRAAERGRNGDGSFYMKPPLWRLLGLRPILGPDDVGAWLRARA